MKKIYIAGKVTGLPIAEVTMKFGAAQKQLEANGFIAINPLEVVNDWQKPWNEAMKLCLKSLMDCDAVLALPDSGKSKGARLEILLCTTLNIPICTDILKINAQIL